MADFVGYVAAGITNQSGSGGRAQLPLSANILAGRALPSAVTRGLHIPVVPGFESFFEVAVKPTLPVFTYTSVEDTGLAPYWFELVHSLPSFFAFGNLLASVTRDVETYSSYRTVSITLQTVTQTAGVGVTLQGLSGLPIVLPTQSAFIFQVHVTTDGPPILEGDIIATFDVATLTIPMDGIRVVMFPYEPESPLEETLEFSTTVLASANNTEQRISLRKNPRQKLAMMLRVEDDSTRRKIHSLLHGWQPGIFGIPIWFEARYLVADAATGVFTIQVDTKYADFRTQSLAIIWQDEENFDALEIASFTDTAITFSSALTQDFVADQALVMPLRVAHTEESVGVRKAFVNLEDTKLVFNVIDNDSDLADTSAFPTHNSKVLLDEANKMSGNFLSANLNRKLYRIDNNTGAAVQTSDWGGPVFITQKGFQCSSPQRLWEIRQLLHALHGAQKTFYLPTFYHDMVVVTDTINGDTALEIQHIDYTTYINGQAPSNHLWIELTDGTIITKEIVSSSVLSDTVERLILTDTWSGIIPANTFARVSYLRTARIGDEAIKLTHTNAGEAEISMLVREVTG